MTKIVKYVVYYLDGTLRKEEFKHIEEASEYLERLINKHIDAILLPVCED